MICPVCNEKCFKKIFEIKRPDLGKDVSYRIWGCKSCTFKYANGPVNIDIMSRIYNERFHMSSQQYAPVNDKGDITANSLKYPIVKNAVIRVDFLQGLGSKGDLLDIGAGRGYFVKVASNAFNAEGIELNPHAAAFGTSMKAKIISDNFLTHDFGGKKYDVITMWDVLAGFSQPKIIMAKMYSLLKRDGLLVMTLPDGGSVIARFMRQYWPLMIPPANLGFHTSKSINRLLTANKFQVKQISHEAKFISIDFLLRKLFKTFRLTGLVNKKIPLGSSVCMPLNLRDIMTVIAIIKQ